MCSNRVQTQRSLHSSRLPNIASCPVLLLGFMHVILSCCWPGLAVDPVGRDVLDLIESLNTTDVGTLFGLRYTTGPNNSTPALLLDDTNRHVAVPNNLARQALSFIVDANHVTFLGTIRQEAGDSGTILSFSSNISRFLELESSGKSDELRFHYTHQQQVRIETFPYRLADGLWHKLALTLRRDHITIYVDCQRIYQRVIQAPDRTAPMEQLSLFLGQRNGQQALFKGALQDLKIATQDNGYLIQCPSEGTDCPTCVNVQDLEKRIGEMVIMYDDLTLKLSKTEQRLSQLEQCQCLKSCDDAGTRKQEGEEWRKDTCSICRCQNGSIECRHENCPPIDCTNPIHIDGECCPSCPANCFYSGKYYDHGDQIIPRVCVTCTCNNGRMVCEHQDIKQTCPQLTCPKSERIEIHGQCCPVCKGTDFCSMGHTCHSNASCFNLATRYACQCHAGFEGDGHNCEDIDECQVTGGRLGHHCNTNTVCVNNQGSYRCDCINGHSRVDTYECTSASNSGCIHEGRVYSDGSKWNSPVEACQECTCQGGRTVCHYAVCDCKDSKVDFTCCITCNVSNTCAHQELSTQQRSGDSWVYQCQKCECVHGEINCWPLACPKLTCENAIQRPDECCPVCTDSNPCVSLTLEVGGQNMSQKTCLYMGMYFSHGEEWQLENDQCTSCQCQAGHICCTFSQTCTTPYSFK